MRRIEKTLSFEKLNLVPESWSMLFAAFSAAYSIGFLSLLVLPFLIGASMDSLGLNEAQAGLLGTGEFLGIMAGSLAIAPFMGHIKRRNYALLGAFIAITGNAVCSVIDDYHTLLAIRPMIGIGCGLALATGNATVANARDPERMASHMAFMFVVLMIITTYTFPFASTFGLKGSYAAVAVIMAVSSIFLVWLPQGQATNEDRPLDHPVRHTNFLSVTGIFMLLAAFCFSLRDIMQWSFVERIGVGAGYTTQQVGQFLSIQAFIGLLGPVFASLLGSRIGLGKPVIFGVLATGAVTYFVIQSAVYHSLYIYAVMGIAITYFFALAYLTALAAELDREGRIAAGMGSFMIAGAAISPAVIGSLIVSGGYALIGKLVIGFVLLTLFFVSVPLATVRKRRSATDT